MLASCESKNNAFLFWPMLGENWHNNHHAIPASASTWVLWYQVDFCVITLRFLECFGLVKDIRVEIPSQPPTSTRPPPTGLPVALWTLWAIIFATIHHVRTLGVSGAASSAGAAWNDAMRKVQTWRAAAGKPPLAASDGTTAAAGGGRGRTD